MIKLLNLILFGFAPPAMFLEVWKVDLKGEHGFRTIVEEPIHVVSPNTDSNVFDLWVDSWD